MEQYPIRNWKKSTVFQELVTQYVNYMYLIQDFDLLHLHVSFY